LKTFDGNVLDSSQKEAYRIFSYLSILGARVGFLKEMKTYFKDQQY